MTAHQLTQIHRQVEAARRGASRAVIGRARSGWFVIGEVQRVEGCCLLLPDPVVGSLNDLAGETRARFLADMVGLGDALLEATEAYRINYEILGNLEPALHAHVVPRYRSEPEEKRVRPIWDYDERTAARFDPEVLGPLLQRLAESLRRRRLVAAR